MIVDYDKAMKAMEYFNSLETQEGDIYIANPRTGEVTKLSPEQLAFYDLGADSSEDIDIPVLINRKQRRQQQSKDRRNAKREHLRK